MADISTWSPVDESNNQPPPAGWPEGMAPSAVNNSARAVMGAVRRFYDQTINGTLELPYLKLSGGDLTGSLSAVNIIADGGYHFRDASDVLFAFRDAASISHIINDGSGAQAITLAFNASYYRNGSHTFQNEAGITTATISDGGLAAAGIAATGDIVGDTITANHLQSNGNIDAIGDIGANNMGLTGNLTAGNITGAAIIGNTVHAYDTLSAGISIAAPSIAASFALSSSGNCEAASYTRGGVPVLMLTADEFAALTARIEALEGAAHAR